MNKKTNADYKRKQRGNNPDKIRAQRRNWGLNNPEKVKMKSKSDYQKYKEYHKKRQQTQEYKDLKRNYNKDAYKKLIKDCACYFCMNECDLEFHHLEYNKNPKQKDVITVCNSCHKKLHFNLDFQAKQLDEKNSKYTIMCLEKQAKQKDIEFVKMYRLLNKLNDINCDLSEFEKARVFFNKLFEKVTKWGVNNDK